MERDAAFKRTLDELFHEMNEFGNEVGKEETENLIEEMITLFKKYHLTFDQAEEATRLVRLALLARMRSLQL